MGKIRQLPNSVVVRIAAGEVIERPSCIVKELLENALDAGASHLQLAIAEGGTSYIEVRDNGSGIALDDLALALTPHATSKLTNEDDLWSLSTRGFRGEALASIASVSQLELISRTKDQTEAYKIVSEGGILSEVEPMASSIGTIIRCKNLFFNTPARKKFLKSSHTEKSHIDRTLRKLALSAPHLSIEFYSDGEQVYQFHAVDTLEKRIAQLFGKEITSQLRALSHTEKGVSLEGFVSTGEFRDGSSGDIWVFVNGRPVQDRTIQAAILEGYRTALMQGKYPLTFLYLTCASESVDVNIHPRKNEVRFTQGQQIFRAVSHAVARALANESHDSFAKRFYSESPSLQTLNSFQSISQGSPSNIHSAPTAFLFPENRPQLSLHQEMETPKAQLLGQLDQTYLLVKTNHKLMIIDQHAAHERILFEQFRKNFALKKTQALLIPEVIELSFEEEQFFKDNRPMLEKVGFEFEEFGTRTIRVLATPFQLKAHQVKSLILKIIKDPSESFQKMSLETWIDDICASLACHSAVRAHDPLTNEEMTNLLNDLQQTHLSSYCPHGRPSWIELSVEDLEKLFKRVV